MTRRWYWISFVCIVVVAAALRLWQLGQTPVALYWDEAAMFVDVKSVLATGQDMHGRPWFQLIYPSYGDYKLPVYIWAATASALLFGLSEFSLRLPSAVAGVATVLIAGWLVRAVLELVAPLRYRAERLDIIQLTTMAVAAISPWSLIFSRTAFEGHIGQMLLGLSVLLTIFGIVKKNAVSFYLAPVIGALATYSYYSVRFVWLAVFAGVIAVQLWKRWQTANGTLTDRLTTLRVPLGQALLAVLLFFICLFPLLRSPLAKDADRFRLGTASVLNNDTYMVQSNVYRELAGNSRVDRVFYNRYWLMGRELIKNYSDNLSPNFLFVTGDPNLRHGTGQHGLFYLVFSPFLLIGFAVLFRRHLPVALLILVWWFAALLPASVPENTPHALRSLNAFLPLVIAIGFGISWSLSNTQHRLLRLAVVGGIVLSCLQFWWFYSSVYPKLSADDWQSGYKPLALEMFKQVDSGKHVYIKAFDDRYYLWLMGYGPFTGKDFHQWKTADYKFIASTLQNPFSGIEFSLPEEKTLREKLDQGQNVELAGETESITTICATATLYTCSVQTVRDEAGRDKFMIATLKPTSP